MKKVLFFAVTVSVILISCTSQKDAINLNETIVQANKEIKLASQNFTNKFETIKDNNYSDLEPERQKMVNLYDTKIAEINAVKSNMKEGDNLKNNIIEYYKFERDIYETDYKQICQLAGAEGDQEKFTSILVGMQAKEVKEGALQKELSTEQEKFAKANNLKLE